MICYTKEVVVESSPTNMSNHIIRVHHPELTPEEHERRMNQIKRAAEDLLIAAEKAKQHM